MIGRQKAKLGPDQIEVVKTEGFGAVTMIRANRPDLAEPLVAEMIARVGDRRADDALQIAERLAKVGVASLDQGWAEDAEGPLRACLTIRAKHRPGGWLEANARSMLGGALTGRDAASPFEVETLLRAGYEGLLARRADILPRGRNNLPLALDRLIRFAESANRPAELAAWKVERAKYPTPLKPPFLP